MTGRRQTAAIVAAGTAVMCMSGAMSFVATPAAGAAAGSGLVHHAVATPAVDMGGATLAGVSAVQLLGAAAAAALAVRGAALLARAQKEDSALSRRNLLVPMGLAAAVVAAEEADAEAPPVPTVDLPDRINADPFALIGMDNPDDGKADKAEFYMKRTYRQDTYQVLKHMKISASLDKGTPNMEKWNKRVKEEMNDWVALYRRQDAVVGRQSYYSLYSAVNTLASHFTSYGPKFPFPSKRRPRFYELVNQTEKYLEKGK
mmetsp:Transcript_58725/g.127520  ORF Transcript_58725/g.127520 Transcript_58725/m.127520 type:complete len:259 (-) Transcript_58725:154-930(-)